MQTQLFPLTTIFTDKILRIPDYQRGYAWTEIQLKDFWNDLIQLEEDKSHYTGVLTLEEVPKKIYEGWSDDYWIFQSKGFTPYYVVDGQQRLTTSIILIQAIIERIPSDQKLNFFTTDEIRKRFIFDSMDNGISRSYIFGYEKDNPSYEFLKTRIFLEKSDLSFTIQETVYTSNLEFAKKFFLEKLRQLSVQDIEVLYRKLTLKFLFNIYSIAEEIDVFVAFETMNNRGKPLSHLELLKNRLIYLSTKFKDESPDKDKLRNAVNEAWKSIYHFLGKNKDKPLDDDTFLENHFNLYFHNDRDSEQFALFDSGGSRSGNKNYRGYLLEAKFTSKNIGDSSTNKLTLKDTHLYVQSLKESVETWYYILNPKDSPYTDEEKNWLSKFERLQFSYLRVGRSLYRSQNMPGLLMTLFLKESSLKTRIAFLKTLERFTFFQSMFDDYVTIHYITEAQQRPLSFNELAEQLFWGKIPTEKLLRTVEQYIDDLVKHPSFKLTFPLQFEKANFYSWNGIRYFLYEYELELQQKSKTHRSKIDERSFFYRRENDEDFVTIEHIYPQKSNRNCWQEAFNMYSDKQRKVLKNSLGNLVPLSRPKNASLQNKCFEDKKGNSEGVIGFKYGSYSENEIANCKNWTAIEILERGLKLLDFMEQRWRLKIGNKEEKIKLLGLDFVVNIEKLKIN